MGQGAGTVPVCKSESAAESGAGPEVRDRKQKDRRDRIRDNGVPWLHQAVLYRRPGPDPDLPLMPSHRELLLAAFLPPFALPPTLPTAMSYGRTAGAGADKEI